MSEAAERLSAKISTDPATGCHNWTGGTNPKGYGRIKAGDRQLLAHRLAYELAYGPIPDGLVIDHLCRNPACCNPDHLEAVTTGENTRRGNSGLKDASKTHCPKGHPYSPENTYVNAYGHRSCRTCVLSRTRTDAQREKDNQRRSDQAAAAVLARGGIPRKKRRVVAASGGTASPKSDNQKIIEKED